MCEKYLDQIRQMVVDHLKAENVKIILFGSRARKDHSATSDIDIGIIPLGEYNNDVLTLLKEKIENLNIPYKVEIVDFSYVSDTFRKNALKGAIIWKGSN